MRHGRRSRLFFGLGAFALCASVVIWVSVNVVPRVLYGGQRRTGDELFRQLSNRRPSNIDVQTREIATNWATTAYRNICFGEAQTPLQELKRFCKDLEARLQGRVDLTTIDWIWERLGQTGPYGNEYRLRFEPQYHAELEAVHGGR
jgi:hypothetical protein